MDWGETTRRSSSSLTDCVAHTATAGVMVFDAGYERSWGDEGF
jgi:hypothetical protein